MTKCYITCVLCVYLYIVSALVSRLKFESYLLISPNYKTTGVPYTHSVTYLRSAVIENIQCVRHGRLLCTPANHAVTKY